MPASGAAEARGAVSLPQQQRTWPDEVGIVALETYFPHQYVDQAELETFDGASQGKYTVGLGQLRMGFCTDREDINSMCLTAVQRLLASTGVPAVRVGRLEVGTETLVDKSKSVKTVLMQLFEADGNTEVEGIDTTNACYGGTAALFNAIAWIESSYWDGRYAVVVAADIAVYATGPARPTGGAGAVAMLVGPNAPLVFERGARATHMQHAYDFYKPDLTSEYPVVDGALSIKCYLAALDTCYQRYVAKIEKLDKAPFRLEDASGIIFHTPFCKLIQKSVARLYLNDFVSGRREMSEMSEKIQSVKLEESYFDKEVEKTFVSASGDLFRAKTAPSLLLAKHVGNMYTASLYGGLVSHLVSHTPAELRGQRLLLFSYGSGLASSMFSVRVSDAVDEGSAFSKLLAGVEDVPKMLEDRTKAAPQVFAAAMKLREDTHHKAPYTPVSDVQAMFPGTWYLAAVDEKHRRTYAVHQPSQPNGVDS